MNLAVCSYSHMTAVWTDQRSIRNKEMVEVGMDSGVSPAGRGIHMMIVFMLMWIIMNMTMRITTGILITMRSA
jgi:hypothetical protein